MILSSLLLVATLAQPQAMGSVKGTIRTGARGLAPVRVTFDQKICGNELPDDVIIVDLQGHLANAVVTIAGLKRPSAADPLVTNEKCRFVPRVQVARPRATLRTTSKDPMLHTTQAQLADGSTLFNLAVPMPGITLTRAIGTAGPIRLNCNIHMWMRGWVVVTEDAASVSGTDGRFAIDNVPPGTYELRVWHESLKGPAQKITVVAGKPTDINFQLK